MNSWHKLFLKWLFLVSLNAGVSFYFALAEFKQPLDILGVISGILTMVIAYTILDYQLVKKNTDEFRALLLTCVWIKMTIQIFPVIEINAGILAMHIIEMRFTRVVFITPYLITLLDGFLLSLVVGFFMLMGKGISIIRAKKT
jgi:hypothetical protein